MSMLRLMFSTCFLALVMANDEKVSVKTKKKGVIKNHGNLYQDTKGAWWEWSTWFASGVDDTIDGLDGEDDDDEVLFELFGKKVTIGWLLVSIFVLIVLSILSSWLMCGVNIVKC